MVINENPYQTPADSPVATSADHYFHLAEKWTFWLGVISLIGLNFGGLLLIKASRHLRDSRGWFRVTLLYHAVSLLAGIVVIVVGGFNGSSVETRLWNIPVSSDQIAALLGGGLTVVAFSVPVYYLLMAARVSKT